MKRNVLIASLLIVLAGGAFVSGYETEPVPPKAKVVSKVTNFHGDKINDDYFWLRNSKDPDVLAYLKAENEYTSLKMEHTQKLQEKLYLSRNAEQDQRNGSKRSGTDRRLPLLGTNGGKQTISYLLPAKRCAQRKRRNSAS